ncbi:hypothetical protein CPB97_009838 [Podila verticillata]|nr:hypothetical protein CPB97_009838 [Podila verticillata]
MEEHNQLAATLPDSSSSIPESTAQVDAVDVDTTPATSQPDQNTALPPSSHTTEAEAAEAIAKLPEHDLHQYTPLRESTPTPKDIEAVSEVTSQAFSKSFSQETADDIKALTNALTTPMTTTHSETHDAVAATVAALSATVAAASSSVEHVTDAQSDSNNLINQVLSIVNAQPKTNKRTADQEMYDQNQAAQALQSIAQSLSNLGNLDQTEPTEDLAVKSESKISAEATSSHMEGVQSTNTDTTTTATGPSVAESLMAISQAINFPTQSDSTAFAQAILNATQAEVAKKADGDQSTLQTLNFPTDNKDAVDSSTIPTTAASSNNGQAFTFEVDKVTGKTQLKWSEEPSGGADSTLTEQANATLQAFHSLLVSSGIAGLADLTGSGSSLLAPPIGAFPAQGSQFGTAQDPPVPEPATQPPRKKKKTTNASNGQNTAASIPEGATSYPCTHEGCDKVFARLYNLKSHQRTHTNERNFVCATCSQAFARNHDLKRHVKIHGGDKPFKCNGCGKSFSRLDALGRHRGNSKNRAGCASVEAPAES